MARVVLTTLGSYGDLYPYLALGIALQRLGHEVTIATSATYRAKVEGEKLGFAPIRPDMSLDDREMMQYLFDQRRGTERVLREVANRVHESYEDTLPVAEGADAIVSHPITFASPLIAEKLGLRWISSVLAPISFLSAHDPPIPAPFPGLVRLRVLGPTAMRAIWGLGKWASINWFKPVARLRQQLGLPAGGHPMFEAAHSPGLVLALFSSVFAEVQPDWPAQTVVTGFPFYDSGHKELSPELQAFFDAGPPPVVFTLGSSAVSAAGRFYSDSLEAVARLNVRAVFLTGSHPQDLPTSLPPQVKIWPYAPHELVFAGASAIVHQGGVGTTAQALRSGRPNLVVPFAHDQFDNAERVRRLGAGLGIARSKYTSASAETSIRRLLGEPSFQAAAAEVGRKIRAEDGAATAAQAIDTHLQSRHV